MTLPLEPDRERRPGGGGERVEKATPHETPVETCDVCGSTDLWWRNCKLLCRSCNAIVKSCADL